MKKLFLISLLAGLSAGHAQSQNVLPGVMEIQLKPEIEQHVQQLSRTRQLNVAPGPLQVGIKRFDELNAQYNAVSLERIFPDAGEHEEKHRRFGLHLWYRLKINQSADVHEAVKAYGTLDEISTVSPVYPIKPIQAVPPAAPEPAEAVPAATGNDPRFSEQWHYHNTGQTGTADVDINLPEAWDVTTGSPDVIVAVVDGGIDYTHPDLAANMWSGIGRNFINSSSAVTPENHGTHVAGTIAAVSNNGIGVAGIAGGSGSGNGVRLMSCQIFDSNNGNGDVYNAIVWAADHGAVICQNSWGYEDKGKYNSSALTAIRYFIANASSPKMKGGIVIFAAGNDSDSGDWYPARWDEVMAVAAIGPTGKRAYYSNYDTWVDISAPGGDAQVSSKTVLSTITTSNSNPYGWLQGTSMACPHVSGVAALIVSKYGHANFTPDSVWLRLTGSARSLLPYMSSSEAAVLGAGLLDAHAALAPFSYITGITITGCPAQPINPGSSVKLSAAFTPETAFDKQIIWSSSNKSVATVSDKGVVNAVGVGAATITARAQSGTASATCEIDTRPIRVEGVEFVYDDYKLTPGERVTLRANVIPNNASDRTIIFTSDDPSIVTVSSGSATAVNFGRTFVVATSNDGGHTDMCYFDVVKPVTGVRINPSAVKIKERNQITLEAEIEPADANNKTVFWQSDNTLVAGIDVNTGVLTAGKGGSESDPKSATIKVTTEDGNYTATARVEVYEAEHAPQGFSPNGDGINDYFELALDSREDYTLTVFDRSGQTLFVSKKYDNKWDGTANTGAQSGKKLLSGTYYYSLTGNTSGSKKTGYVVIRSLDTSN